jgi:hypothetical protein
MGGAERPGRDLPTPRGGIIRLWSDAIAHQVLSSSDGGAAVRQRWSRESPRRRAAQLGHPQSGQAEHLPLGVPRDGQLDRFVKRRHTHLTTQQDGEETTGRVRRRSSLSRSYSRVAAPRRAGTIHRRAARPPARSAGHASRCAHHGMRSSRCRSPLDGAGCAAERLVQCYLDGAPGE